MNETTFDPKTIFDSYKTALAPALNAQQEGVKALASLGRYQYAVAGDYLEWSLAQAKAVVAAQTPAEFVSKQVELTTALVPGALAVSHAPEVEPQHRAAEASQRPHRAKAARRYLSSARLLADVRYEGRRQVRRRRAQRTSSARGCRPRPEDAW